MRSSVDHADNLDQANGFAGLWRVCLNLLVPYICESALGRYL